MRFFVTGGTGFIGSHFLNSALESGHKVCALRRNSRKPRVPLIVEPSWIDGEMAGVNSDSFRDCEVLVHLAAHSVVFPRDSLHNCLLANLMEPLQLIEKAIDAGVRRFVVAGSCFEYGKSAERYEKIPTTAPLKPIDPYSASKAAASVSFLQLAKEKKVELILLRIFQAFGEGEAESRFWPSLRRAAKSGEDFPMTAGEQVRDFIPVDQVAAKFLEACELTDLPPGEPIVENVGTGQPQTLLEFAETWWRHWQAIGQLQPGQIAYRPNEIMRYVPEVSWGRGYYV